MLFSNHFRHFKVFLSTLTALILLPLSFISCQTEYEYDGDILAAIEEDTSAKIYFKKDETSPVAFTKLYKIGTNVTLSDLPDRYSADVWNMNPGYDLGGWKTNDTPMELETDAGGYVKSFHVSRDSITLYGDGYTISSRTPYKINLYVEKFNPVSPYYYDPKEYDYYSTVNAQGTTDTNTNALMYLPSIPGYKTPVSNDDYYDDIISANGSTVINVYYKRRNDILLKVEDITLSPAYTQTYGPGIYGEPLAMDTPVKQGYKISRWKAVNQETSDETYIQNLPTRFPAYSFEYSPEWTALQVPYTVYHNLQNTNLSTYTTEKIESKTGYTDSDTAAVELSFTGFELASPIVQKTIKGDGSTVVEIKYNRSEFQLTFDANGGSYLGNTTITVNWTYGIEATLPHNSYTRSGYTFEGWATSKARANAGTVDYADAADFTIGAANQTLYAVWKANTISISIEIPEAGGIWIDYYKEGNNVGLMAMMPDGTTAEDKEYTFKWFFTNNGMSSTECEDWKWEFSTEDWPKGIYQISLIATKDGIPSGGTIQIEVN